MYLVRMDNINPIYCETPAEVHEVVSRGLHKWYGPRQLNWDDFQVEEIDETPYFISPRAHKNKCMSYYEFAFRYPDVSEELIYHIIVGL